MFRVEVGVQIQHNTVSVKSQTSSVMLETQSCRQVENTPQQMVGRCNVKGESVVTLSPVFKLFQYDSFYVMGPVEILLKSDVRMLTLRSLARTNCC